MTRALILFLSLSLLAALSVEAAPIGPPAGPGDALRRASRRLHDAEALLRREPTAREVQRWAVRSGGLRGTDARRLVRDARAAGALPWVRLRGRFEDDGRLERDEVGLVKESQRDTGWTAELWLEWDLAEAVAGSARFRAAKELRDQLELNAAIVHQVTLAYHDRQRLFLEDALDTDPKSDPSVLARRAVRTVRIRELDATLDAMTDGRWTRALARLPRSELPLLDPDAIESQHPLRLDLPPVPGSVVGDAQGPGVVERP